MKTKIFIWVILSFTRISFCQQVLDISNLQTATLVEHPYAEILRDSTLFYSKDNIIEPYAQFSKFSATTSSTEEIHNYWIRFKLKSNHDSKWLMEIPDPHIHNVTLYELRNHELIQISEEVGFGSPFNKKKYSYKNFLFDINSSSKDTTLYYINFKTQLVNSFIIKLQPAKVFIEYSLTEYYLLGIYYGLLTLMAIYNFAIYLRVKEKVYLFYVSYVLFCALNSFTEDGLGFQFIWPNMPEINLFLMRWVPDLLLLSFLAYSVVFLNLFKKYKKLVSLAFAIAGVHIIMNFVNITYFYGKLNLSPIFLTPFAIIYLIGIYKIFKGNKSAKYFIAGYSFILISLVIFYLRTRGITVFYHIITIYSFNIGFLIEVVVLSYALGERLRSEKSEKEIAQQKIIEQLEENDKIRGKYTEQLEEEVKARTSDLRLANEEIQKFNDFLKAKNLKLEIDVKNISKERVTSKLISLDEFKKIYDSEENCKDFLFNRKWKNSTYKCAKCGSEKQLPSENYSKRCAKCKYVESSTANTIFHGVKIPLPEAFYILYAVCMNKSITAEELSKTTNVSERSCSVFKKKIQDAEKTFKPKHKKSGWEYLIDYNL